MRLHFRPSSSYSLRGAACQVPRAQRLSGRRSEELSRPLPSLSGQEAYVEYLRSISFIAQALLEEATAAEGTNSLACLPPASAWVAAPLLPRASLSGPVKPAAPEKGPSPAPVSRHRRVFSDEGGKLSPFLPPEIFQKLQLTKAQGTKKELTPLEEASLQNQKLRATYEARVAREDLPASELPVLSPDRLLSLTLLAFEGLNSTSSKDQCLACIEDAFFSPLWAPLLALYRANPNLFPQNSAAPAAGSYPYSRAVQELGLMLLESCPQKKLDCIGEAGPISGGAGPGGHPWKLLHGARGKGGVTSSSRCSGSGAVWGESTPTSVPCSGADDLLPILSYVVLKSNLPQLAAECAALEEFIHEGYLIGEEGYCLTSLQSALSYVESLPGGALGQ
nr:VPS9 domain-containing protein 1 [Pelodiscus sinensis]|eukprot:XP_025035419.1 VPS9 domain-containing protein 1 [Pelodiscus sinensis]